MSAVKKSLFWVVVLAPAVDLLLIILLIMCGCKCFENINGSIPLSFPLVLIGILMSRFSVILLERPLLI